MQRALTAAPGDGGDEDPDGDGGRAPSAAKDGYSVPAARSHQPVQEAPSANDEPFVLRESPGAPEPVEDDEDDGDEGRNIVAAPPPSAVGRRRRGSRADDPPQADGGLFAPHIAAGITAADADTAAGPTDAAAEAPATDLDPLLFDTRPGRPRSLVASALWACLAAALLITASAQALVYWRDDLLQVPWLNTRLLALNEHLGRPLEFHYDPARYRFVERPRLLVREDGETGAQQGPGADRGRRLLDVRAELANTAAVPQPLPHLRLILEDRWGRPVAVRTLAPEDYAVDRRSSASLLAPGERIAAALTVASGDAAPQAFSLDICLPWSDRRLDCGSQPTDR